MISRQYLKTKCFGYELQELCSGMCVLVDEIYGWMRSPRPYLLCCERWGGDNVLELLICYGIVNHYLLLCILKSSSRFQSQGQATESATIGSIISLSFSLLSAHWLTESVYLLTGTYYHAVAGVAPVAQQSKWLSQRATQSKSCLPQWLKRLNWRAISNVDTHTDSSVKFESLWLPGACRISRTG
jgi:hypothetical protein